MSTPNNNRLFWLITYPRVGSHLLWRILNKDEQPGFLEGNTEYYFFEAAMYRFDSGLHGKNVDTWTEEQRHALKKAYQDCFDSLQLSVAKAKEENKSLLAKEHSLFMVQPPVNSRFFFGDDNVKEPAWQVKYNSGTNLSYIPQSINVSVIPESFLSIWNPTFLIRHPALTFESQYRAKLRIDGGNDAKSDTSKMPLERKVRW
jgi:hypothetical protein